MYLRSLLLTLLIFFRVCALPLIYACDPASLESYGFSFGDIKIHKRRSSCAIDECVFEETVGGFAVVKQFKKRDLLFKRIIDTLFYQFGNNAKRHWSAGQFLYDLLYLRYQVFRI